MLTVNTDVIFQVSIFLGIFNSAKEFNVSVCFSYNKIYSKIKINFHETWWVGSAVGMAQRRSD